MLFQPAAGDAVLAPLYGGLSRQQFEAVGDMLTSNHDYLRKLLRAILLDDPLPPLPADGDWTEVFKLAIRHDVFLLVFDSVGQSAAVQALPQFAEMQTRFLKFMVKSVNQTYEIRHLDELLDSEGIAHLFLKGAFLRAAYPKPELREMCDIDILIPQEREADALRLVKLDGYEMRDELTTSHNTEHFKLPYQALELHTQMVPRESAYFPYYESIWTRIRQRADAYACDLSLAEQYVYLIVHMAKHYYNGGTGLRSILDIAVFERAYGRELDRAYTARAFAELGLSDFARDVEALARNWFSAQAGGMLTAAQEKMQHAILTSSTYGSVERKNSQRLKNEIAGGKSERRAKLRLFFERIFPSLSFMTGWWPPLARFPFLLPAAWVARWVKLLFCEPKKLIRHYRWVRSLRLMEDDREELAEKK